MNFYNDNEPYVAQWLRNLELLGYIPPGDISEEPIQKLESWQLINYDQAHFFAGIGGWPLALKMAGWPSGIKTWTGSCPCQPFSVAGQRKGMNDERHLWPSWFERIRECRPEFVFGEQVEGAIGQGWLDGVFGDLEAEGYTCGAVVLGAHSVGAPHIRQRLYWVAYTQRDSGRAGRTANKSREGAGKEATRPSIESGRCSNVSRLEHTAGEQEGVSGQSREPRSSELIGVADVQQQGLERFSGPEHDRSESGRNGSITLRSTSAGCGVSYWNNYDVIPCADGKARRVESRVFPLASGVSARVGKLRAYGNAIVPPLAAEFVRSVMDVIL